MELSMPVVWSDRCLLHEPSAEIWVGVPGPAAETPARARAILDPIGARVVEAEPHPDEALLAVHDGELLAFLASAWADWSAAELPQEQVVPYVFAHRELGAVALLAPPGLLGSAFGALATIQSFANLAASAVAGALWTLVSPRVAFLYRAG